MEENLLKMDFQFILQKNLKLVLKEVAKHHYVHLIVIVASEILYEFIFTFPLNIIIIIINI